MDAKYCPTCAGEGEIEVPYTWDVAPNGNDADGPWVCEHAACQTCGGSGERKEWHAPELVEHEDEGDPSDNYLTWNAVS